MLVKLFTICYNTNIDITSFRLVKVYKIIHIDNATLSQSSYYNITI